MQADFHSYRFAQEILQHPKYQQAWTEITQVIQEAPLFVYHSKSTKHAGLDVVQQVLNAFFDRRLAVDLGWGYHPLATEIEDSGLSADFRKTFEDLPIQVEVQFGNMARWYSDVFKFQTAYSQGQIRLALSIVPKLQLARRIDQNVVSYERVVRELPSAELSLTLPILVAGLLPDETTPVVDLTATKFPSFTSISRKVDTSRRIVHAYLEGRPMATVGEDSPVGPVPQTIKPSPPTDADL